MANLAPKILATFNFLVIALLDVTHYSAYMYALRAIFMQTAVILARGLLIRPSVRHIPVFCPDE